MNHCNECRPIVCDNVAKCAPSAENILKDPISDGLYSFCMERMVFGEVHKGEILEAA